MKHYFVAKDYGCVEPEFKIYQIESDSEEQAKELFVQKAFPLIKEGCDWNWFKDVINNLELEIYYIGTSIKFVEL